MGVNLQTMVGERTVNVLVISLAELLHLDKAAAFESLDLFKGIHESGDGLAEREDDAVADLLDDGVASGVVGLEEGTESGCLDQ